MSVVRRGDARSEAGMSIVEMTVTMLILSMLLATMYSFLSSTMQRGVEVTQQTALQGEGRQAIDQLTRELHQAGSGNVDTATVETMTASTITFLTPDAAVPYHERRITYTVVGTELRRATVTSTDSDGFPWSIAALPTPTVVLTGVQSAAAFTYFDTAGAATAIPSSVAVVKISLALDAFPGSGAGSQVMTSTADIRVMT